ncbi:hypothetical protein ACIGN6_32105 [Streptomyces sp. NPDC053792]|uniref:hypothetical protein n=1 Tax=Streptomyces sp. NPDC053792 TaxID=3365716 RepID=UPI0037CEFBD6
MPPESNAADEARKELTQRLTEAKTRREEALKELDRLREETEKEYWTTVKASLEGAYHGAQKDATEILGVTRDHILKKTKQYGQ